MYDEKLKNRIYEKLDNVLKIYEQLVYQPVGALEHAEGYFTTEHLRSVPDSGFMPIAPGTDWGKEWENLWVKGDFTVPADLDGQTLYVLSDCGGNEQLFFLNGAPKGIFNT